MKNGLYALASLDGAPLDRGDLLVMGLDADTDPSVATCMIAARDRDASASHVRRHADGIDAFLGYLDEPADAADRLGLPRGTPPLTLACAAFDRFGEECATTLLGLWTLARWHAPSRTMSLVTTSPVRDRCYVATNGRRLAIAPELLRLARLDWVDDTLDPRGVLLTLGRAPLRRALGRTTIVAAIKTAAPGARLIVRGGEVRSVVARRPSPPAPIEEPFDAWMERIEAQLRLILRQWSRRHGRMALMLSGGLDSSLLAMIAALECGPDAILALTSAAPPGSGLPDEAGRANETAAYLGIAIERIMPPPTSSVYRPSERILRDIERPAFSPRHSLDEAFVEATEMHGLGVLLNGGGGEYGVSSHGRTLDRTSPGARLRNLARAARDRLRPATVESWPEAGFHPRLSRAAIDGLPADFEALSQQGALVPHRLRPKDPLGFDPGIGKVAAAPTSTVSPTVRSLTPLMDRRFSALMAAMPAGFAIRDGMTRAPARALMRDRLPVAVARRTKGMPFSPSYDGMMSSQAGGALDRLALHRAAGADEWIDLDWMETTLRHRARESTSDVDRNFELQMTVLAAEFFTWWRSLRR